VVNAQVQAGQRYMRTQTNNVFRRLEQMHDESDALRGGIDDPAQSGLGLRGADSPGGYGGSDYALRGTDGTYPGQPQLPTRKGPSPQSLAVGRLSSTLPGAMAALDSKGLLPFHIWADGSMEFGNQQANGLYSNRFSTDGLTVGADGTLFRNFKGGLAFGFGFDQSDVGSDGSNVKSASYNATAYGSYKFARSTYLDMFVGMGRVNFDTNRWSSQGNTTLASNRSGTEAYGSIALTQDIRFGGAKVAPYGRLDASWLALGSATESGSSAYAMTYQGMAVSTLSGVLGTRLSWSQAMAWGLISPQLRVEYRHDFNGAYDQALYFANVGGAQSASVAQGAIGQDAYTLGLGLDAAFAHGAGVSVEYDYAGSASTQSQTVRLTARQAF